MASRLFDLIVFDLDGTLLDSLQDLSDSANELVVACGGRPLAADQVARMVGEGVGVLVERIVSATLIPIAHADAVTRYLEIYDGRLLHHTRPYPGIPEFVREASERVPLAVLTNKPAAAAVKALEGLGLARYFREIAGGDGRDPRKPAPEGLRRIIAGAGALPQRTLMVGDSAVDMRTARNAGTRFCYARYGFGSLQFPAGEPSARDFIVDSPRELPAVLDGTRPAGTGRESAAS
jgi:phosphoglycolate phosphatase